MLKHFGRKRLQGGFGGRRIEAFREDVPQQWKDVAGAFTQGGQAHRDNVEAEKQVFPEPAFARQPTQIAVGGANEPEVHGIFTGVAYRAHALFLDGAQQAYLGFQGHIPNLIQEESSAVGLAEATQAVHGGPGEGPLAMTEQFAFQQAGGQGPAVDRYEWPARPAAAIMYEAGQHFLSRSAFSPQAYRAIAQGGRLA